MKSYKSASLFLIRFKEHIEIIMMNISSWLKTTQTKWMISILSSSKIHLEFSKGSQKNKEKDYRSYLPKKLQMLKKNLSKKL